MSNALAAKTCTPCRGGVDPLDPGTAEGYRDYAPGLDLTNEATWLRRRFAFRNFADAAAFVQRVGAIAEAEGHHPDICFGWGYAEISWQTHKIKGLHENDFIMAAKVNELAEAKA